MATQLVDLEDPAYKGKSMAQVEKAVWAKDVAELKSLGVVLSENHMDGYLFQPARKEQNLDPKPWEANPLDSLPIVQQTCTAENWDNPDFKFEIANSVAYLTINRPEVANTINQGVTNGFGNACAILKDRPDVRVAVLTGAGRMFCAGADPKGMLASSGEVNVGAPKPGHEIVGLADAIVGNKKGAYAFAATLYQVAQVPQYTIACVNGSAMGGGVGLLCICDLVIAVKQAYITLSEVKLGMIPATISPHVLGKMRVTNAKRLFCTAENLKATTAQEMGLVQHVVDNKEGFEPIIKDVCAKLQQVAPGSLRTSKEIMLNVMNGTISNSMIEYTVEQYVKCRKGPEAEGAMKALTEKKKPSWLEEPIVPRGLLF